MNKINRRPRPDDAEAVLHWFDFLCPFCYVGQRRDAIFELHNLHVTELPFLIHPDIPPGGMEVGPRSGAMYDMLEQEAHEAGLPLHWPRRLPDTRMALAAAEWVRQNHPDVSSSLNKALFKAHFALGEDLGDPAVIDRYAEALGIDLVALHAALTNGSAEKAAKDAEMLGRRLGVSGTPAWFVAGQLISGLRPVAEFERLAKEAASLAR